LIEPAIMQLKLKENPREWQKFTAVMALLAIIITALLWRRGVTSRLFFFWMAGAALVPVMVSLIWPKPFRTFYRVGMTASYHVGKVIGTVMLTLLFLLILTPLALLLRAMGKDLLQLKRPPSAQTYWQPARKESALDRMF
jgi:hypothetical protein